MSREAKLVEALNVALERWQMYADRDRLLGGSRLLPAIADAKDAEGELYRMCAGVLKNARDKETR